MNKNKLFAAVALLTFAIGTGSSAMATGPGSGIKDDRMDTQQRTTGSSEAVQKLNPYNHKSRPDSKEMEMHRTTKDGNYYDRTNQTGSRNYMPPNSPNNR